MDTVTVAVTVAALLFGLLVGSFANVAIYRWPRNGSVMRPSGSHCPSCDTAIKARDNVPVISWLLLRGRCRTCGEPIAGRYPAVELLTGIIFGAIGAAYGLDVVLPVLLGFAWVLVVAAFIDIDHRIIPNLLTLRAAPVFLVALIIVAGVTGEWADLRRAVIAGIAVPAGMLAFSELFRLVRGKVGIGMGDVKLAATLGLVLGYLGGYELIIWFYATAISAVVVAFSLIAMGRARLATRIPFGPYLALGALVAVIFAGPLARGIASYLAF